MGKRGKFNRRTNLKVADIAINDPKPVNNIEIENKPFAIENSIASPEIKELSQEEIKNLLASNENKIQENKIEPGENDKRSWL